mgnify:CR=1 FL=1
MFVPNHDVAIYLTVLYVFVSMLFFGVILGGVGMWISIQDARSVARSRMRRVKWLEAKLEEERKLRLSSFGETGSKRTRVPGENALKSDRPNFSGSGYG